MKLCLVIGRTAYFSAAAKPCGDDWDDAPYQHNAGEPYGEYISLGFRSRVIQRPEDCMDASVDEINEKHWWLHCPRSGDTLRGGASIGQFIDFVLDHGGSVVMESVLCTKKD